jgi:hypothetical protein
MTDPLLGEVQTEIVRLHDFFTGWFSGTLPLDAFGDAFGDAFEDGFAARLHPGFENVQPAGKAMTREDLLNGLRAAYGSSPDFRIEIRDTRLLGDWPECGLVLASYIEAQFGARNTTPSDNLRRATVLFERGSNGLIWRHVHETAMPL